MQGCSLPETSQLVRKFSCVRHAEHSQPDKMFKMLFDRLRPDVRERALSLWNSKPPNVCGNEEGIVRTNGFGLRLPTPKDENVPDSLHSGTFLDLSRCDHRCVLIF